MKKFLSRLLALSLLGGGLLIALSACSDDDKTSGGGGGGEPDGPDVPDNYVVLPKASGIYFGDEMEIGVGHYSVILYSEGLTLDDAFYFEGTGEGVYLELYSKLSADPRNCTLEPGTYKPIASEEEAAEFTFVAAQGEVPSFLVTCVNDEEIDDFITDGEVLVTRNGDQYAIQMTLKAESGAEKSYKYEGRIAFHSMVAYGPDPFEGVFADAQASYFGDYYQTGIGNFELALTDLADEEAKMGHTLYLDLNTTKFNSQSAIALVPGTYTCDKTGSASTVSTFNPGSDDGEYYYGSLWVETDSEGGENVLMVTDGTCTVTRNGAQYTVSVSMKLDNGETRTGTFTGTVGVSDESCLTRLTGDVSPVCTKGVAIFYGDAQYYQNNSYNWTIWLASSGIDLDNLTGKGEMMQFSINTTRASTTEIPSGDYEVMEAINTNYLVPFSYIPGYFDSLRGSIAGTWYTKDLVALGPCVAGTLHIENKGGGNYAIRYDFVDDYYYTAVPHTISGSYDGALQYIDDSQYEQYGAPARIGRAMQPESQGKSRAPKRLRATHLAVRR